MPEDVTEQAPSFARAVKGSLAGSRAHGTLRYKVTLAGGVTCQTPLLTWSAKRPWETTLGVVLSSGRGPTK